ncbi:MAG: DUF6677 family protein [Thermoanaerobaculia bacterium]
MSAKSKRRKSPPPRERAAATDAAPEASSVAAGPPDGGNPYLAAVCAWLLPGAGHLLLARRRRALVFFCLVAVTMAFGLYLQGNMPWVWQGSPLRTLATAACLGNGLAYVVLRFGFGIEGDVQAPGFDYGSAFILTAGLMNLLLILDAWDIARGSKE